MDNQDSRELVSCFSQTQAYARDLADVYQLEKESRRQLEIIRANQERLRKELALAVTLQERLLPDQGYLEHLADRGLHVFAHTLPASEVNGDTYFISDVDQDNVAVSLADCKGHGVSAGMLTLAVNSLLKSYLRPAGAGEIVADLDNGMQGTDFVALSLILLNTTSYRATLVSAGLPFPCIINASEGVAREIPAQGPPLGLGHLLGPPGVVHLELEPGDRLVLFSDGLCEARRPIQSTQTQEEYFAIPPDRFLDLLQDNAALPLPLAGRKILQAWQDFHVGNQEDDCTLVILERR
jgi:serine phosphatase RsbU (regulator of sigma subunit)